MVARVGDVDVAAGVAAGDAVRLKKKGRRAFPISRTIITTMGQLFSRRWKNRRLYPAGKSIYHNG
jgi:hypothetical protein